MRRKRSLLDLPLAYGQRVLLRTDYNVPFIDRTRQISDDSRISESLPTIQFLLGKDCRVIVCSHRGRPHGTRDKTLSMAPVTDRLTEMIGREVDLWKDGVGEELVQAIERMSHGGIMMLENIRFHPGEEANDPEFARSLARIADIYVNDGFGVAHRNHASTAGVARFLPSAAGLLMMREIEALESVTNSPQRPFVVAIGGAKVSDKIRIIDNLADTADIIMIGGGMVSAFLEAHSPLDSTLNDTGTEEIRLARRVLSRAASGDCEVLLPTDVVVCERLDAKAPAMTVQVDSIPTGSVIADVGPRTVSQYVERLSVARTVVWNGPMGVFEWPQFSNGTTGLANAISYIEGAHTVIGGGSTAAAVRSMGLEANFSHVSTGGGAALAYLEGQELPGIAALDDAPDCEHDKHELNRSHEFSASCPR